MIPRTFVPFLLLFSLLLLCGDVVAVSYDGTGKQKPIGRTGYKVGDGLEISDAKGRLQYVPFPTCNETGRPLTLHYGVSGPLNCTVDGVSDEFFHLLEFYIHNDSPLTCRIPARPYSEELQEGQEYIPLTFAVTGVLQLSHLHVRNYVNVIVHADGEGGVDSAGAYSVSGGGREVRVVIGDELGWRLGVWWAEGVGLEGVGEGGKGGWGVVGWCILSILLTLILSTAYFRLVEFPRRARHYSDLPRHTNSGVGARGFGAGYG
ncbi:hypothetical protein FGG08_001527, partial [Glutinoglossum americanum]